MTNKERGLPPLSKEDLALLKNYVASQGLPEQVEAITSEAPLTVVGAGAGTGKTWTLAWRFVWTVLTREDVRHMLTLTFTEKAASEMRRRIAALLADLEPALAASAELSRRRAAALVSLDQAYISTIHGFGARVIGEAGLSLPVEPSPRLVGDAEASEFWRELAGALDRLDAEWFCWGMDREYGAAARELLNGDGAADVVNCWGPEGVADFARSFEGMMSDFGETPESVLEKLGSPDAQALELLRQNLGAEFARLADCWTEGFDVDPGQCGGTGDFVARFIAFRARWNARGFESEADCREFVFDAADTVKNARGKLADALAGAMGVKLADWRRDAEALRAFERLLADGWSEEELKLRALLIRLGWLCWRKWQAYKASRGGITFADMIALAAQALERDESYAARFSEVLVDEFQDTNDQQDALLRVVRRAARARLFVVGDLKQSIYRFRRAEPAIFGRYVSAARRGGRYVSLSVSFRSGEKVLDAVNDRFEKIWKERLGAELNQPYEALRSPRGLERTAAWIDERQRTELPVCERLLEEFQRDEEEKARESAAAARDRLALRLALRLCELRGQEAKVWGRDRLRPVRWGDMAVLTPTRSSYENLQRAFSLCGVPAAFTGGRSFYARPEIRDACALCAFLADPRDRTALAGFLCSPFSGLPLADVQALLPFLDRGEPLKTLAERWPGPAAKLRALARQAMLEGPSSALASLLARGDCLKSVHPKRRAAALANLRRAVALLEAYEAGVAPSPAGVAAYLRSALRRGAADPEASAEAGGDTVKVMTIHASKGLEFPLVAVFGLEHGGRAGAREKGVVPSRHLLAAAQRFPDNWPEGDCLLGKVHARLDERAEYEERTRLYYVALTRARDGLILCGLMPGGEKRAEKDRSLLSIERAGGEFVPAPGEVSRREADAWLRRNTAGAREKAAPGADVPLTVLRPRALRSVSATSHALWSLCPAAWRLSFRQNLDLSWSAGEGETLHEAPGGAELGNVAHWILSKWDFSDGDYRRILGLRDGHLRPEFRCVWRDPASRRELERFLRNFHSPDGEKLLTRLRRALAEGTLAREYPFKVRLGPVDLVGAVDVFWIESDAGRPSRLCVRDYKTARLPKDPLRRRWLDDFYARQLRFYALALRRQRPEFAPLTLDLALWNLRGGAEQKLEVPDASSEKNLETALLSQASQAAEGPWPPDCSRCAGCPCARACVFRGRGDPLET
ncbi:UvrD-helicase domain-containing protein [Pyramidobacter piscolens]|uniref:UvrD-helicase domain-containing protein n=1 Tax=Pyramidobacter piscolens TaxID=638849 RepID=UPI0026DF091E|nr:UvrD-helicase domain-containing protein [Pyramidobacter piscolens]